MTLPELAAKFSGLDQELAGLKNQVKELSTANAAVSSEAANSKAQIAQLTGDLATAKQTIGTVQAENAALKASLVTAETAATESKNKLAELQASAPADTALAAARIVASAGLPAPVKPSSNDNGKSMAQQYSDLTDPVAKAAFWATHKNEILNTI